MRYWILAAILAVAPLAAQTAQPPRLSYMCSFKASTPSYVEIEVSQEGRATFQAKIQDADPLTTLQFTAAPALVRQLFADADAAHDFAGPTLQSKNKVAFTGEKRLTYDDGARHQSQMFTYTSVRPAAALVRAFQQMTSTGTDAILLRRAMNYQPLDVLSLMDRIRSDWDSHMLGSPELLAPVLRQLIASPAVMEAARNRARKLLEAMHLPPA
ncbi:MAG: hypothetical protein ACRD1A_08720 [Terriglobales bacterium]